MSYFMSSMPGEGLMEMPPESRKEIQPFKSIAGNGTTDNKPVPGK